MKLGKKDKQVKAEVKFNASSKFPELIPEGIAVSICEINMMSATVNSHEGKATATNMQSILLTNQKSEA